jgi:AraC-like DNA-binding protein
MDLIWADGTLLVAGPDTMAHMTVAVPAIAGYTGLRFGPGTGPAVIGLPADELRDLRVPLADLWPAEHVAYITERIHSSGDPAAVLEEVASDSLRRADPPDPAIAEIVARARAGEQVAVTAWVLGWGERQLHRRCLAAFGYGPKTLMRILRMDRAVAMARSGIPFAAVAANAGYADQAHLAREVRGLAGVSLGVLTA